MTRARPRIVRVAVIGLVVAAGLAAAIAYLLHSDVKRMNELLEDSERALAKFVQDVSTLGKREPRTIPDLSRAFEGRIDAIVSELDVRIERRRRLRLDVGFFQAQRDQLFVDAKAYRLWAKEQQPR